MILPAIITERFNSLTEIYNVPLSPTGVYLAFDTVFNKVKIIIIIQKKKILFILKK